MDTAQQRSLWPLVAIGGMIFLAVAALFYTYVVMQAVAPACMSGNTPTCRDFVPWMWVGIGLGASSVVMLAIALFSRRNLRSILVPIGVAAILSAVAFVGWRWLSPSYVVPAAPPSTAMTENNARAELLKRIQDVRSAPDVGAARPLGKHPFPAIPLTRAGLPYEDDPFVAASKQEQDWLDRNGYPNAKQWAAFIQASDAQLAAATAAGDRSAKSMLDHRRLLAGDDTAIDAMLNDGANGSGFALEMLASYLANPQRGERVTAYAVSRAAEMRGNLRLAMSREGAFSTPLSLSERMQAEQDARVIYNSLYEIQQATRGINASPVDPRPIGG